MLQAALLLLGCALSRYLWGIDTTVASVVIGVTSSGMIIYIFIVIAGAASESCPYQTPGSYVFRYLGPKVWSALRLAASAFASGFKRTSERSEIVDAIKTNARHYRPWWSRNKIGRFLWDLVLEIPRALAVDAYRIGRAMIQTLATFPAGAYRIGSTIAGSLVGFVHWARNRLRGTPPTPEQRSAQRTTVLDFRCISWMLQTSLDKAIRLPSLKHLAMMTTQVHLNPTLVADCFNVFISCINVNNHKVVVTQGLEQLAEVSAMCFLRTFHHLSVTDPASSVLEDVRWRYRRSFPLETDFRSFPFYHAMAMIRDLADWNPHCVQWDNYKPSTQEHVTAARDMAEAAQAECQKSQNRKVPRFIIRFALHSLSLCPLPPAPVIADCLMIIAIDLGCDVSNAGATTPDERCVHVLRHCSDHH